MRARDKHSSVAVKKAKRAVKRKVKVPEQIPLPESPKVADHAASLANIADALAIASTDVIATTMQPPAILAMLSNIFAKEFHRVRGIE